MVVSQEQALAWRLGRHFLRDGACSAAAVVRRLSAVPAWSGDAELAVRRRMARPGPGAVDAAFANGELIKTYAFRGGTHVLAAEDAGAFMAVRGAGAQWTRRSWRQHYGLAPEDWPALRHVARAAVADGPIARRRFLDAIAAEPRFRHLRPALSDPSHTLLKPLAWQGDICFGPVVDGEASHQSPGSSPLWRGLPEVDEAGRRAVRLYLAGYGPATRENLSSWLVAGLSAGRRRLDRWLGDLGDDIAEIRVGGRPMLHLRDQLDGLAEVETAPEELTLLPGHDQWVLGPGTADERIVAPEHRQAVSRGANLLLHAGRVAGTWKLGTPELVVSWFQPVGHPPRERLEVEAQRLSDLLPEPFTSIAER